MKPLKNSHYEKGDSPRPHPPFPKGGWGDFQMEKAIARLICDLKDDDCHIRFAAARVLGDIGAGNPIVANALIETLKDDTWFVRLAALQTIREIRLDPLVTLEKITPMLEDEHEDVREYAAFTFGDLGPKAVPVITPLMETLSDTVWYVRETVVWALGEIGPGAGGACGRLIRCLTDDEIEVRIMAARALGMISQRDDRDVLAALEEAVRDKNQPPEVREKAREALARIRKSGGELFLINRSGKKGGKDGQESIDHR